MTPITEGLERNLRLIPWHVLLTSTNPWISVFVLFTRSRFGLDGAVALAGIYYLIVVVFEVPSGWMSDRLGRVLTLRVAAAAWVVAFTCFLFGEQSFVIVAVGQAFMAIGYASISGTDVTFHYDTLEALDRRDEYPDRQSWVASRGLLAAAVGALTGGLLGLVDLRLAFLLSLILTLVQLGLALTLVEPPASVDHEAAPFVRQISQCLRYLRNVPLAWIFGYGVAMVVLEHVAFTLLQPWLTEALDRTADDVGLTPLLSGAIIATTAVVGSIFARTTPHLARTFGVRPFLFALAAVSATIVSVMAFSTHLAVLALIAFRSAQGASAPIVISTAVSNVVAQEHRATLLSLNSLGGRLSYGALLLGISTEVTGDVGAVLRDLALISWVLVALIAVTALAVRARHGADHSL